MSLLIPQWLAPAVSAGRRHRVRAVALFVTASALLYLGLSAHSESQSSWPSHLDAEDDAHSSHTLLLVSAYFPPLDPGSSRTSLDAQLAHLLRSVESDLYIYTREEEADTVRNLRGALPLILDTAYNSTFDVSPLRSVDAESRYATLVAEDKRKYAHSPSYFALQNARPYFVDEALRRAGKQYDYAFWLDVTAFEEQKAHLYRRWPDPSRVHSAFAEGARMLGAQAQAQAEIFAPMWKPPHRSLQWWNDGMGPVVHDFLDPSFFGGGASAIASLRRHFYTYHTHYLTHGILPTAQSLFNALALAYPARYLTVWPADPTSPQNAFQREADAVPGPLGTCGPPRAYYQWWLARGSEREAMCVEWERFSAVWGWWRGTERCRKTEVTTVQDVLRQVFGDQWTPSAVTVH